MIKLYEDNHIISHDTADTDSDDDEFYDQVHGDKTIIFKSGKAVIEYLAKDERPIYEGHVCRIIERNSFWPKFIGNTDSNCISELPCMVDGVTVHKIAEAFLKDYNINNDGDPNVTVNDKISRNIVEEAKEWIFNNHFAGMWAHDYNKQYIDYMEEKGREHLGWMDFDAVVYSLGFVKYIDMCGNEWWELPKDK